MEKEEWRPILLKKIERMEKKLERYINLEREWRTERVLCECGSNVSRNSYNKHLKTKKHKRLMGETTH
jgi:hypothetical protein